MLAALLVDLRQDLVACEFGVVEHEHGVIWVFQGGEVFMEIAGAAGAPFEVVGVLRLLLLLGRLGPVQQLAGAQPVILGKLTE